MLHSQALLDRIFESICRPLKVRIEQVLLSLPPALLCFQLTQLPSFYRTLVAGILGGDAHLPAALQACHDIAHRVFFEQLRSRGDKLVRNPPAPPADLSPPAQVCLARVAAAGVKTGGCLHVSVGMRPHIQSFNQQVHQSHCLSVAGAHWLPYAGDLQVCSVNSMC